MVSRGRRAVLVALVALVGCVKNGSTALVVVADVQELGRWLRAQLDGIAEVAKGRDRGVDARIRACGTSLEVFELAIGRAAKVEDREVRELLASFFERYEELIAELDAEGMRRNGRVLDDAGAELAPAPSRDELELVTAERLRTARVP